MLTHPATIDAWPQLVMNQWFWPNSMLTEFHDVALLQTYSTSGALRHGIPHLATVLYVLVHFGEYQENFYRYELLTY